MKVLVWDERRGYVKLYVEGFEDLWVLRLLIRPGDRVRARTVRMVKLRTGSGELREGRRFPMELTLRVEATDFDRYGRRLRVRGVVVDSPDRFEGVRGSYHTINVKPGSSIALWKEKWYSYELEKLKEAGKTRFTPVILVSIDQDEACIAVLRGYGFDVRREIQSRIPGKGDAEKRMEAIRVFYSEVFKALTEVLSLFDSKPLIVVLGPGHFKEEFVLYLKDRCSEVADRIRVCSASSGGVAGLKESLRSGVLSRYVAECRAVEEADLIEGMLKEIGRGSGLVVYGLDFVEEAASYGAVKLLVVSEKLLSRLKVEEWERLNRIVEKVESMGGRTVFVGGETEAHDKLLGLGGVLALLRYPLEFERSS